MTAPSREDVGADAGVIEKLIWENRLKWRLIEQREVRLHLEGKDDGVLYPVQDRQERDLVRRAYAAGRDAAIRQRGRTSP